MKNNFPCVFCYQQIHFKTAVLLETVLQEPCHWWGLLGAGGVDSEHIWDTSKDLILNMFFFFLLLQGFGMVFVLVWKMQKEVCVSYY